MRLYIPKEGKKKKADGDLHGHFSSILLFRPLHDYLPKR